MNIRNNSLREDILATADINLVLVDNIINTIEESMGTVFSVGDTVLLKLDLLMRAERQFEINQVKTKRLDNVCILI